MARTTEEIQVILNLKRKQNKPSYFSSQSYTDVTISSSTEDSLILATSESKSQAVAYLKLILDASSSTSDQDTILGQFITQQQQNTQAKKTELDNILTKFNSFKNEFIRTEESDVFVEGMAPLMKSLNKGIRRLRAKSSEVDYDNLFFDAAPNFFDTDLTETDKQELRSWVRVILAYV